MKISIITPGAKGGYGGISKYNSNIIEYLLKNKKFKKIFYFHELTTYRNKKIKNICEKNIIITAKLFINQFNFLRSDIIFISHINLILFAIIPILLRKKVVLINYGLEIWGTEKSFIYHWLIKKINFHMHERVQKKF